MPPLLQIIRTYVQPATRAPDVHTTMVALADAEALADPARPLLVADLYDTPGQVARVPLDEAGSMAADLEIANMDFADLVQRPVRVRGRPPARGASSPGRSGCSAFRRPSSGPAR
ncbi:DUF6924 domain-containing protein [Actinomadura nitritigenes]|uniref:DUF6924 domain-containing protein n=1 Tax=Actinomadura nitritigenes TaxID=134602 RepID=UPI003D91837B